MRIDSHELQHGEDSNTRGTELERVPLIGADDSQASSRGHPRSGRHVICPAVGFHLV